MNRIDSFSGPYRFLSNSLCGSRMRSFAVETAPLPDVRRVLFEWSRKVGAVPMTLKVRIAMNMTKEAITGNPDADAQRCIDKLHEQFLESHGVNEPAWAEPYFRQLRQQAFDAEIAERMTNGQCFGESIRR